MKDQYDNPVPTDLVVLSNDAFDILPEEGLRAIDALNWYEDRDDIWHLRILVSYHDLKEALAKIGYQADESIYTELPDVGLDDLQNVNYINMILHRYSPVDGWYHA